MEHVIEKTVPLWAMMMKQWEIYKERFEFDRAFGYVAHLDPASADAKMKMCLSENVLGDSVVIPENGHDFIPKVLVIPSAIIPIVIQLIHVLKKEYLEAFEFRNMVGNYLSCESLGEEYPYIIDNVELGYSTKGFAKNVVDDWAEKNGKRMLFLDEVLALVMLRPSLLKDHGMLAGMSRWEGDKYPGLLEKDGAIFLGAASFGEESWGIPTCMK